MFAVPNTITQQENATVARKVVERPIAFFAAVILPRHRNFVFTFKKVLKKGWKSGARPRLGGASTSEAAASAMEQDQNQSIAQGLTATESKLSCSATLPRSSASCTSTSSSHGRSSGGSLEDDQVFAREVKTVQQVR